MAKLLRELKGVGEKTEKLFQKIGITTTDDLLHYYPRNYDSYEAPEEIGSLKENSVVSVRGTVTAGVYVNRIRNLQVISVTVADTTGRLPVVWFNTPYLKNILKKGSCFIFRGKISRKKGHLEMEHPEIFTPAAYEEILHSMQPIYGLTAGLTNKLIIKLMHQILDEQSLQTEFLPDEIKEFYHLADDNYAISTVHFPGNMQELLVARKRLVFDEFLLFILAVQILKGKTEEAPNAFPMKPVWTTERVMEGLPYDLTKAQLNAWHEIERDLCGHTLMSRLVQGDVGSGKTILAFLAMILTRPLQKLSQVSKQIADGDYSVRVPVHTEDEIGELSVSFNYMTEQLIEKLMKLDQLLKNQEEFMGSFAHEMKTPLTSIIGYADLMRMEALSKEEQKEACGYIYSEGKRLQNLSLKLMKLLVLKNQQFQMKKQDLEPMIQEAVISMQYRLKEQDILVNLNLKKAICKIEPDLLKSLILNLIDNALKSMNSGGILTVEDRATQEGAKIYISDTGCGMPKDEISKITEAFYRIDKSRSRKQGGVGLGLAICKEIVRIHQGEMRFISQQGKGTTVIITIGGGAYEKTN